MRVLRFFLFFMAALYCSIGLAHAQTATYVFPAVPVGGTASVQTIPVPILLELGGAPLSFDVLTEGVANKDFTLNQQCVLPLGILNILCNVKVQFAPKYPGVRRGAVVVHDALGKVLAVQQLIGTGVGPLSVMSAGVLSTVAGGEDLKDPVTDQPSTSIQLPLGVAADDANHVWYSDSGNNIIRRIDVTPGVAPVGAVVTIAGTSAPGSSPDGTLASVAQLNSPGALLLDGAGDIFFADTGSNTIREIRATDNKIYTVAGTIGTPGYTGDNGPATKATLTGAEGIAFDGTGNLYIADTGNNVIRRVDAVTGIITTVAGSGIAGYTGDSGPATSAQLNSPWGVAFASDGSFYIADFTNNVIRKVSSGGTNATITTIAGSYYSIDPTGNGGPASAAGIHHPSAVLTDAADNLFISDSENNVIRKINGVTQIIDTIAGNTHRDYGGDGQNANAADAAFDKPYALALDGAGNLYIAEYLGLHIRGVSATTAAIPYSAIKSTNTSPPVSQTIENDGNATLTITSVTPTSNSAIDAASTTCLAGAKFTIGTTCIVGAEFKPSTVSMPADSPQPVLGTIDIKSDSPSSPITIDLTGLSLSIFPTSVTVNGTPNPGGLGAAVTFIASITATGNTQTLGGTVSFYDGSTPLGTPQQVVAGNTASYITSTLTLGSHSITAVYIGDPNDAASDPSPAFIETIRQVTGVSLLGAANPAQVYDKVTFTATVAPINNGGSNPTGPVVFSSDGAPLPGGSVTLSGGVAVFTTALLAQGSHTITAAYAGDSSNLPSSANFTENINLATSTTTLNSSQYTAPVTTAVTFTASVSGVPTSIPTGKVIFNEGSTVLGSGTLDNHGNATFTTSTLAPGSHFITATYQGDNDYATSSSPLPNPEVIQKIVTAGVVTPNTPTAVSGASVQFTVVLTAQTATNPNTPITGTINLMEGTTLLGTGTLTTVTGSVPAAATVTISSSKFTPGSHAVTAVYGGDANYVAISPSTSVKLNTATTTTNLVASTASIVVTKLVTFTATVTGNGATPGGSITFKEGTTVLGNATLSGGVATLSTTGLAVGTHNIVASYSGDADDGASDSLPAGVTIQSATTSIALTPSQSPSNFGQALTLTARLSSNGGLPTGTVTFSDNGNPLNSATLNNGVAVLSTSTLTVGNHALTAVYGGDASDLTSSATINVPVLETIGLTLTSPSPNPSVARSNVHLVATIVAQQGIQPTGLMTFKDGAGIIGTGAINGTTATLDISTLAVGTHALTAVYPGDTNTQSLASAPYSQTINAAGTSINLTSSANPATFGAPLTFTAVASSPAGPLSGTVIFQDGGVSIGQGTLSGGVATFTLSTLTPGSHTLVAAYQGDANDQPANSSALAQTVERATTVALSSSQNPLLSLAPVVVTATVANGGGSAPTGTITFTQDGAAVGTAQLSAGVATLSLASLPVGGHVFTASYAGDPIDFAGTSAPLTETVQLRATTDGLSTSASSLTGGQQITLTSVIRWTGPVTPTGIVSFFSGSTLLGTSQVDANGISSYTVLLSGATVSLTSTYSGDASYATSTSDVTKVTIGAAPNITLTVNPSNWSMKSGTHTTVSVGMASVKGFSDTFELGCLGLPYAATCTFSSDKVTVAANGTQTLTLTFDTGNPLGGGATTTPTTSTKASNESASRSTALACFLPGALCLFLCAMPSKRLRRMRGLLLILCMAGMAAGLTGCASVQTNSTPVGSYTFQVTAVGQSGVTQFVTTTVTVQ